MATLRAVPHRPTFWVEVGVALTWVVLVVTSAVAQGNSGSSGGSLWSDDSIWVCTLGDVGSAGHAAASSSQAGSSLLTAAPMWGLMAVAMMVPPALPTVRHVAVNSLYWRRRRAVLEFLLGFLAIWVGFSVLALGNLTSWEAARTEWALAAALILAAVWQLTPFKRRALRACHRPAPLPPHGWRATLGATRFGLRNGAACFASCWAMMVAVALATSSMLVWMAALTLLIYFEQLNLKPRAASRRVAALLATAAAAAVALALLG